MRRWGIAVLCLSGCNGLFEANPGFGEIEDTSSTGVATGEPGTTGLSASNSATNPSESPSGSSAGSSGAGETAPLDCGEDIYEDNDEQSPANLGTLIAEGPFTVEAQVDDTADEDWFKVDLLPTGAQRPHPSLSVVSELEAEVCVFVSCSEGVVDVDCGGYQPATANSGPNANPGCCATGDVGLSYDCPGSVELEGFAYVRVRAVDPIETCLPYVATIFDAS